MDWMYNKDNEDNEQYLLGKKVALKADEQSNQHQLRVFQREDVNQKNEDFVRMMNDPLMAIKKAEEAEKQAIMDNPMKL